MTTFNGILNIELLEIDLDQTEIDSNKNLDLFVLIDQRCIYQTTTKSRNLSINESFASEVEEGKNVELILFNETSKSPEDSLAKGVISFDDILKKEKINGVFKLEVSHLKKKLF